MSIIEGTNVTVGHLGIVAGMFDKIGIEEYIDNVMPKTRHHKALSKFQVILQIFWACTEFQMKN